MSTKLEVIRQVSTIHKNVLSNLLVLNKLACCDSSKSSPLSKTDSQITIQNVTHVLQFRSILQLR